MIKQYIKKPAKISAIEWTGDNFDEVKAFAGANALIDHVMNGSQNKKVLKIRTELGIVNAEKGDFIIQGTHGDFYPCKADIFKDVYQEV